MRKIVIQHEDWQTRVAVLDDKNKLQDLYFEAHSRPGLERCFFKGKISKILPGIQTAFVDIGQQRSGFLHISEIDRAQGIASLDEGDLDEHEGGKRGIVPRHKLDIAKVFTEGESTLVQVIKEPVNEKGAKLTTCFTLPGKFVVLMPNIPQIGVSRKIEQASERERLREIIHKNIPEGMGVIIRTTAEGRSEENIVKDLSMLVSLWNDINKAFDKAKPGEKVHQDLPITLRSVREHLDDDVESVVCDDDTDVKELEKFVRSFMPEHRALIQKYEDRSSETIFEHYGIESQIAPLLQKKVHLKSGGTLVIESTEAMTVIDVNTSRFTGKDSSLETTILKTNLEAAEEVVRQLRLRNIGGLIVIDFIDMFKPGHRQKLSRHLEKALKEKDKFQSVTLKVSEFGLVQMTRKRSGKTLAQSMTEECHACRGNGFIRSAETESYVVLSDVSKNIKQKKLRGRMSLAVSPRVFSHTVEREFAALLNLEKLLGDKIEMIRDDTLTGALYRLNPAPLTRK